MESLHGRFAVPVRDIDRHTIPGWKRAAARPPMVEFAAGASEEPARLYLFDRQDPASGGSLAAYCHLDSAFMRSISCRHHCWRIRRLFRGDFAPGRCSCNTRNNAPHGAVFIMNARWFPIRCLCTSHQMLRSCYLNGEPVALATDPPGVGVDGSTSI